jgi:hypothetical protein
MLRAASVSSINADLQVCLYHELRFINSHLTVVPLEVKGSTLQHSESIIYLQHYLIIKASLYYEVRNTFLFK